MGDIADMILEGLLSEDTGEVIDGDSPGYPRKMPVGRKASKEGEDCPICGKRLKSESGVSQHMQDKHPHWREEE